MRRSGECYPRPGVRVPRISLRECEDHPYGARGTCMCSVNSYAMRSAIVGYGACGRVERGSASRALGMGTRRVRR